MVRLMCEKVCAAVRENPSESAGRRFQRQNARALQAFSQRRSRLLLPRRARAGRELERRSWRPKTFCFLLSDLGCNRRRRANARAIILGSKRVLLAHFVYVLHGNAKLV